MKHLVMIGAGPAHIHMLSTLSAEPLAGGVQITLIAPYPRPIHPGMVPGFITGHYSLEDCVIPLEPLLKDSSITWLQRNPTKLDVNEKTLTLDNGETVSFDVLSISCSAAQSRQRFEQMMPGAREHALFVHPLESFVTLWPKVVELSLQKPLRFAVIGSGTAGFELACAVAHKLPNASVTLLSGDSPVGVNYPEKVRAMITQTLRNRNITVIPERAIAVNAGELTLSGGARLACDVPLVANETLPPDWLNQSGLSLDSQGFVTVDGFQRSTSHHHVFAVGDAASRMDLDPPRSDANALRAAPALSKNLRAVTAGIEPRAPTPPRTHLHLLSGGGRSAIASWGKWSAQGRWVWWLKNWLDRGFVKKYRAK